MIRYMQYRTGDRLQFTFFLATIPNVLLVLYLAWTRLGSVPTIKGSYVLIALLTAAVMFFFGRYGGETNGLSDYRMRYIWKVVVALIMLSLPLTVFTDSRIPVVLVIFPVVYALIGIQLVYSEANLSVLLQVIGAFCTSVVTKYLDTYRLFGNGDLIAHVGRVDRLVESGLVSALGPVYRYYPGLHIEASVLKLVSGSTAYDGLLLVGITGSVATLFVTYLFVRTTSGRTLAILSTFGATVVYQSQFFATYVFPQALAVFFGLIIVLLSTKLNVQSIDARTTAILLLISVAMVVTHHFTFILFFPIVIMLLVVQWMSGLSSVVIPDWEGVVVGPRIGSLIIVGVILFGYWYAIEHSFIGQLLFAIRKLILESNNFAVGSGGTAVYAFGRDVLEQTPVDAVVSIFTPTGIYFVILCLVFLLGLVEALSFDRKYRPLAGVLLVGVLGSLFILKTPIALSIRLGHPFSLFFGVVIAVGLFRLVSLDGQWTVVPICLIIVLGTTTPIVAGNDMDRLHDGPDFYSSHTLPEPQRSFSSTEYRSIGVAAEFTTDFDKAVTSMWMSSVVLSRFDGAAMDQASIVDCRIQTPTGTLFYRDRWSNHQVFFRGARNKLLLSESHLNFMEESSNKIHTTGQTGILWGENHTSGFRLGCD